MIDRFILDLGIVKADGELEEATLQAVNDAAEAFIRAGGVVDWAFWKDLSVESRAAFVVAGDRVRQEVAIIGGIASQNLELATRMMTPLDGGKMRMDFALQSVVEIASRKLQGKKEVANI